MGFVQRKRVTVVQERGGIKSARRDGSLTLELRHMSSVFHHFGLVVRIKCAKSTMSKRSPTPSDYLPLHSTLEEVGKRKKPPSPTLSDLSLKSLEHSLNTEVLTNTFAAASASVRTTKTCQKDGCNKKLKGKQRIRCEEHAHLCKRKGCDKVMKNRKRGLCMRHDTANTEAVAATWDLQTKRNGRKCQKEGCDKELTGRQLKACAEHQNQCKVVNCVKQVQRKGFCVHHFCPKRPSRVLCLKEGCNNELAGIETIRCRDHAGQCKRKDCKKYIASGTNGFCARHFTEADASNPNNKAKRKK